MDVGRVWDCEREWRKFFKDFEREAINEDEEERGPDWRIVIFEVEVLKRVCFEARGFEAYEDEEVKVSERRR